MFISIQCRQRDDNTDVHVHYSHDTRIQSSSSEQTKRVIRHVEKQCTEKQRVQRDTRAVRSGLCVESQLKRTRESSRVFVPSDIASMCGVKRVTEGRIAATVQHDKFWSHDYFDGHCIDRVGAILSRCLLRLRKVNRLMESDGRRTRRENDEY